MRKTTSDNIPGNHNPIVLTTIEKMPTKGRNAKLGIKTKIQIGIWHDTNSWCLGCKTNDNPWIGSCWGNLPTVIGRVTGKHNYTIDSGVNAGKMMVSWEQDMVVSDEVVNECINTFMGTTSDDPMNALEDVRKTEQPYENEV